MKTELLIQKNDTGKVYELSELAEEVTFTTNRTGSPGKLGIQCLKSTDTNFSEGDAVRFSVDGKLIFFGYIFTQTRDRWGKRSITCYDQTRYLKANQSYSFTGMTAGDIIKKIAQDFQLRIGTIEDTGYRIPSLIEENKGCLDIISGAIQQTTYNTNRIYIFYDDGGLLTLREAKNMMIGTVVGSKSLLTEFEYKTDIDSETFNQIKLVRPNKETGKGDVYLVKDSSTIETWGLLQKYDTVDENMNPAQIEQQAKTMLAYYNRILKSLTVNAIGIVGLRAGNMIPVEIPDLDGAPLHRLVLLDRVEHTFTKESHVMEIETRTLE